MRARAFQIHYRANDDALPLSQVELWYTQDKEQAWHRYGTDDDRQSPLPFTAPDEGRYGLYMVLTNGTGPSSLPPTPTTAPQLWVFVDYSPPTVQCHPLRAIRAAGRRVVQIRWSAADKHLTPRPVELAYRVEPSAEYRPVVEERQTNSGQFDWRLSDDLTGAVQVRILVHDQAGNSTEAVSEVLALADPIEAPKPETAAALTGTQSAPVFPGSDAEVTKLLREARSLRAAGDNSGALQRLRTAVRLNPTGAEAIAELGAGLYDMRDFDRARETFGLALKQDPDWPAALEGMARVHMQRGEFASAGELLERVVRKHPNSAPTWMNLGDIALKQGDEIRARECYHRAATVDPTAVEVVVAVQKRLENMEALSRRYRPSAPSP
ncbi:MAG: tetratricopeptide repeat protein [Phycisphaerales bacterium]|nr:tetratricopeptide repeat protein [Phycisphaerales bacterium]